ncbi:MAG: hypothetical protein AAFQ92_18125 [Bacteroidota bacterium]
MELATFLEGMEANKAEALTTTMRKRFGTGYFGLDAGIYIYPPTDERYDHNIQMNNFNSVSGWATIGGLRWDQKKKKWIISFKGKGLGRTGRYS